MSSQLFLKKRRGGQHSKKMKKAKRKAEALERIRRGDPPPRTARRVFAELPKPICTFYREGKCRKVKTEIFNSFECKRLACEKAIEVEKAGKRRWKREEGRQRLTSTPLPPRALALSQILLDPSSRGQSLPGGTCSRASIKTIYSANPIFGVLDPDNCS